MMNVYQTRVNSQYVKQAEEAVRIIQEQTALSPDEHFTHPAKIVRTPRIDNERLPYWSHPILVGDFVYVDTRTTLAPKTGTIRDSVAHRFLIERAIMEYLWQQDTSVYDSILSPLVNVYGEWVAGGIATRFYANETDRARYRVLAAVHYTKILSAKLEGGVERVKWDELTRVALKALTREGGLPANYVSGVIDSIPNWYQTRTDLQLESLAQLISESSETALGRFDFQTLLQLMGSGSWLGAHNVLLAATALEYPPLFAVLVGNSTEHAMYRNKTRIGRAANMVGRRARVDAVSRLLKNVYDDYTSPDY